MTMTPESLSQVFLESAAAHPERPALTIGTRTLSYAELRGQAARIAATLVAHRGEHGREAPPLSAVLGQRSESSFAGILGALMAGDGYVPMLPSFPPARVALMLERSRARALVVDRAGMRELAEVLEAVPQTLTVLAVDVEPDQELRERAARHRLLGPGDLRPETEWSPPQVGPDDIAYLLFTSGSTGQPKGVMVAHRNILRFLEVVTERYALTAADRFSHLFEVTFDLSLFDMFAAWSAGGTLCCPDPRQRMLPARYVVDSRLSVWFSVPSTALLMKETRTLEPGGFPGLRVSLFCGEALTTPVAEAWALAAPNARHENIYGPTEVTLACTTYGFGADIAARAPDGVVPIGAPFPGMRARVADPDTLREVEPGEAGELLMSGPQVALGYWDDPERTRAAFVVPPGESEIFYRTGDRARRPSQPSAPIEFLGRLDHQIKIRGYRVELGEVEAVLRREAGVDAAVAIGWPTTTSGGAEGIVAFLAPGPGAALDVGALQRRLAQHLPRYMVPRQVRVIDAFPLNNNGKIDRNALARTLQ
ncbi:MAG: amino acid adenylation domain-containing protein [Myxococcales bacterium]|nr:amino acid adenylation domain-containing protein [Myxococcales bacterium]